MTPKIPITYLDESQTPYLFCPGCGHGKIIDFLNQALVKLALDPNKIVIVTDIGCAGLSDKYFLTNAFHGLHGRSVTYATGIKLANPELNVIVLIGDGGCGIGGHHLVNAARRNIGITTIVFNNLNYGMTGGEHSVTTPLGSYTATTPFGQLEHPLDICGTVSVNGASFVARTTTFDHTLPDLIAQAIKNDGYSLLDIWELCTAHFVPNNRYSKSKLYSALEANSLPTGIITHNPKPEYSVAYREAHQNIFGQQIMAGNPIPTIYSHNIKAPVKIILAGAAGGKIGSAASLFALAAISSGLYVSLRNDYPVTVKSGHSISEIIISPEEVRYSGIDIPDLAIVLFPEGLEKLIHRISTLTEKNILMMASDLSDLNIPALKIVLNFKGYKKEHRAIIALTAALNNFKYFPLEAFRKSISTHSRFTQDNLAAFKAGLSF